MGYKDSCAKELASGYHKIVSPVNAKLKNDPKKSNEL